MAASCRWFGSTTQRCVQVSKVRDRRVCVKGKDRRRMSGWMSGVSRFADLAFWVMVRDDRVVHLSRMSRKGESELSRISTRGLYDWILSDLTRSKPVDERSTSSSSGRSLTSQSVTCEARFNSAFRSLRILGVPIDPDKPSCPRIVLRCCRVSPVTVRTFGRKGTR